MTDAFGLTGKTVPVNSKSRRFAMISRPIDEGWRDAPTTATERGRNSASSDEGMAHRRPENGPAQSSAIITGVMPGIVRIGPAGWVYDDWNGPVYPRPRPGGFDPLAAMADWFDLVEIDSTF